MDFEELISENPQETDILIREERCRKSIRTIGKAIVMRLFICGLMIWLAFRAVTEVWVIGLLLMVLMINLSGILPLAKELKKQCTALKAILDEE